LQDFSERMMGLEPTTFCMARTVREVTGSDWSRQLGSVERVSPKARRHTLPAPDTQT
jgi:hypothetical protein